MRMTPPWLRKTSMARAMGLQYESCSSDTKDLREVACGGNLCRTKCVLSNPIVANQCFQLAILDAFPAFRAIWEAESYQVDHSERLAHAVKRVNLVKQVGGTLPLGRRLFEPCPDRCPKVAERTQNAKKTLFGH